VRVGHRDEGDLRLNQVGSSLRKIRFEMKSSAIAQNGLHHLASPRKGETRDKGRRVNGSI
jgi:hypothetical protein